MSANSKKQKLKHEKSYDIRMERLLEIFLLFFFLKSHLMLSLQFISTTLKINKN